MARYSTESMRRYQDYAAIEAAPADRASFIKQTYLHLGGSILACAGLCSVLLSSDFGKQLAVSMLQGSWMLVLVLFMVAGFVANKLAQSLASPVKQYMGLALYIVAEAIILLPMLLIASVKGGPDVIPTAGILTLCVFGGLTFTVIVSKKDFSFMGQILSIASFAALGFIVVSVLFGLSLGAFFSGAMVVLAAGYVLYYTSNILRYYPVGAHVAAALALFSAIALLFWYILQLVMISRD